MLIPKNAFPVSKVCDCESTRYALGAVHIERDASQCHAVATDGRRLCVVSWDDSERSDHPDSEAARAVDDFNCRVPKQAWDEAAKLVGSAAAKRAAKRKSVLGNVAVHEATANGTVTIAAADLETKRSIESRVMDGRFPDWRDVVPDYDVVDDASDLCESAYENGAVKMRVDSKFLAECARIVAEAAEAEQTARDAVDLLVPLDTGRPLVITRSGVREATAVIMPHSTERSVWTSF